MPSSETTDAVDAFAQAFEATIEKTVIPEGMPPRRFVAAITIATFLKSLPPAALHRCDATDMSDWSLASIGDAVMDYERSTR